MLNDLGEVHARVLLLQALGWVPWSLAVHPELIHFVVVQLPERASPKVQTLHKLTLVSHLLIFHWPK